jgi:hypothetical protein
MNADFQDNMKKKKDRIQKEGHLCFAFLDGPVKSRNPVKFVIPAKAGIQLFKNVLDPGFRRGDDFRDFLQDHPS